MNISIEDKKFIFKHSYIENPMNTKFVPHTHDDYELLMIIKGNVSYIVEGKSYNLIPGDIVLSKAAVFHFIKPNTNEEYERYNIIFDKNEINREIMDSIPKDTDVFRFDDYEKISDLFSKVDCYSQYISGEALVKLAKNMCEEALFLLTISDVEKEYGNVNALTSKVIEYINQNITSIQNIEQVCDALFISKSHLHHIFTKYVKMTPKQYITQKRLLKAKKMIKRGARPTDIYSECGFSDYATFFRNFKKMFGCPPSADTFNDTYSLQKM